MIGPDDKSGGRHGVSFTGHINPYLGLVPQSQFEAPTREYLLCSSSPSPPEEGETSSGFSPPLAIAEEKFKKLS